MGTSHAGAIPQDKCRGHPYRVEREEQVEGCHAGLLVILQLARVDRQQRQQVGVPQPLQDLHLGARLLQLLRGARQDLRM